MRRPVKRNRHKLAAESQRLTNLSVAVAQSSSRREDLRWQQQLDQLVIQALRQQHSEMLDAATEHLFQNDPNAYEVIIETLETVSTEIALSQAGGKRSAQLLAAPILAWTRFEIPSGTVQADLLSQFSDAMKQYVLADGVQYRLLPHLFSIDQLPRHFCETYALLEQQAAALLNHAAAVSPNRSNPTVPFLADVRLLLAVIVVDEEQPVFQWEAVSPPFDSLQAKVTALEGWRSSTEAAVQRLLPGCGAELLLPEAYYSACREADVRIRPASVRATVYYLTQTLNLEASELSAIVAPVGNPERAGQVDEYRISFLLKEGMEVVYGVIWPLYSIENQDAAISLNEEEQLCGEIFDQLNEVGLQDIHLLSETFSMEFCDDCGTPLFADREGEMVHPELPEGVPEPGSTHFH